MRTALITHPQLRNAACILSVQPSQVEVQWPMGWVCVGTVLWWKLEMELMHLGSMASIKDC